jgi:phosphonate metabolism protein PhnN/1,5-bisphosphokinase (PRPP-forming)
MSGALVLVVGPSGGGKDTLIAGAQSLLAGNPGVVFPRREITRTADAGGEDHVEVSRETFVQRRDAGGYALNWEAHGLAYGVPASILADLSEGRTVVVNVSRTVIGDARARFPRLKIISISAPAGLLIERLELRGRETGEDAAERVRRASVFAIDGPDVVHLSNDGSIEDGVRAFLKLIPVPG